MSHKTWAMSDMTAVVLVIRAAMTGITRKLGANPLVSTEDFVDLRVVA